MFDLITVMSFQEMGPKAIRSDPMVVEGLVYGLNGHGIKSYLPLSICLSHTCSLEYGLPYLSSLQAIVHRQ